MNENEQKLPKSIIVIKRLLWFFPLLVLLLLMNKHFVPGGTFTVQYSAENGSELLKNFASKEPDRLIGTRNKSGAKDYFQLITTSPIYFDVQTPRLFPKATVTIRYKNPDIQPIMQLGVRQANGAYIYKDLSRIHPSLESVPFYWHEIREGNMVLWQKDLNYYAKKQEVDQWRKLELNELQVIFGIVEAQLLTRELPRAYLAEEKIINTEYQTRLDDIVYEPAPSEYSGIKDFIDAPPSFNRIAEYNYNLTNKFEMPGYEKSATTTTINSSLRGSHKIFTYIGLNEPLSFTLTFQDINRHKGLDPINVKLYNNNNELVQEFTLPDDGVALANGVVQPERIMHVFNDQISFGVYKLEIDVHDDIFIKKIETSQHLIMFEGSVYLTDSEEYRSILGDKFLKSTTIYSDSKIIRARSAHQNGLQTLSVGSQQLIIDEPHNLVKVTNIEGRIPITSTRNDVYIEGEGYFTFSTDHFFDPFYRLNAILIYDDDIDTFDYIVAEYPIQEYENGWRVDQATVEVPYLYYGSGENNVAQFIISLPGLPENQRTLKVHDVTIDFEKEPVTFNNFFTRLKSLVNGNE